MRIYDAVLFVLLGAAAIAALWFLFIAGVSTVGWLSRRFSRPSS